MSDSIAPELLQRLRCPICRESLVEIDAKTTAAVNESITRGTALDHVGDRVELPIDSGLLSQTAGRVYPIRDGIPSLIVEESLVFTNAPPPAPRHTTH